jgi:hypothetical protein
MIMIGVLRANLSSGDVAGTRNRKTRAIFVRAALTGLATWETSSSFGIVSNYASSTLDLGC